jgi:hypothetical protein
MRASLKADVREARERVHELRDWRTYVREHPRLVSGALAVTGLALGYGAVTSVAGRKSSPSHSTPRAMANSPADTKPSAAGLLAAALASAAWRIAAPQLTALVSAKVSQWVAGHSANQHDAPEADAAPAATPDTPSSDAPPWVPSLRLRP